MPAKRGDGGRDGLEVEIAHRWLEVCQRAGDVAVQRCAAFANGLADDALKSGQREVSGNLTNLLDPGRHELHTAPRVKPGKLVDAVIRMDRMPGAMSMVRALVGLETVATRSDVRRGRPGQHALHLPDLRFHGVAVRLRLVENRMKPEQGLEVECHAVMDVVPVERQHPGIAHVQSGALQHPELDGGIAHEDVLQPGRRFHLDQAPAPSGKPLDHVGADQHSLVLECRLKECRRGSRIDDAARFLKRLGDMPVIVTDLMAARIEPARRSADLVTGIEHCLQGFVRLRPEIGPVGLVPETQMALSSGNESRLG